MNKSLRYLSISHKTASVAQREIYHVPVEEKHSLMRLIRLAFQDISGLLILVTCNRTEIYFESETTSANRLRNFLISLKSADDIKTSKQFFKYSNTTEYTVKHLLQVSSGLESSVIGDAEIIHQIKKAHQFSIAHKLQGSLLERAMQAVFKSHKRVSNETDFRDGTTSTAFKSLKVIRDTYGDPTGKSQKILFIGAGDIVKQLLMYNSKFNFNNIYISNRTEERAKLLASRHQSKVYDWNKVIANDFEGFDVIISAASNCHQLIRKIPVSRQKTLLIDLAVPSNIDKALADNKNIIFHDLDAISADLEDTKERRIAAISKVDAIITEELVVFAQWLREAPKRVFLAAYKSKVYQRVKKHFGTDIAANELQAITRRIMGKLMKQTGTLATPNQIDAVITEQISLLKNKGRKEGALLNV